MSELHSAQDARNELLKWKLIVVAALSGAGLGLSSSASNPNAVLAFVVLPFACVYIDLLCRNLSVRSKMINEFLCQEAIRSDEAPEVRFARYHADFAPRRGAALESLALVWSSLAVSMGTIGIGITLEVGSHEGIMIASGVLGAITSLIVERRYQRIKYDLKQFCSAVPKPDNEV